MGEQQGEGAWARVLEEVAGKFLVQYQDVAHRLDSIDARLQTGEERMARLELVAHTSPCETSRGLVTEQKERKEVILRSEARRWNVAMIVLTSVLSFGFAMLIYAIKG